jgi:hypothetical protein
MHRTVCPRLTGRRACKTHVLVLLAPAQPGTASSDDLSCAAAQLQVAAAWLAVEHDVTQLAYLQGECTCQGEHTHAPLSVQRQTQERADIGGSVDACAGALVPRGQGQIPLMLCTDWHTSLTQELAGCAHSNAATVACAEDAWDGVPGARQFAASRCYRKPQPRC